ncbi:PrgI family protein [Streptomyces sp. DSM 44915]|uniref:PrgI family protein n=1 Tax=Streptomyces chisholmiae TaxID=3075540 RepID=A0ABU2JQH6_9ACTN|nr:PrgI family protein [Streptomyces sp. DSM 44915]MDT0267228.1 PrgI family protein [Streptomyces sp. DSM 44915]
MSHPVRIPADIERADRVLGPLTARQTAIVGCGGLLLYGAYWAGRPVVDVRLFLALAVPLAGAVVAVALGRREGITMDRFVLAGLVHAGSAKRMVHAPEGVPALPSFLNRSLTRSAGPPPAADPAVPCRGVDGAGLLDLGDGGQAALAACSTVNFGLRSASEQAVLTGSFGRWLNSLTGPTQIVVRSRPVDLSPATEAVRGAAHGLGHPALVRAAQAHADFLGQLGGEREVLRRQEVLLVSREEGRRAFADRRVRQRLGEAAEALAGADLDVQPLGAERVTATLRETCDPTPPALPKDGGPR